MPNPATYNLRVIQGTDQYVPLRLLASGVLLDTSAWTARAMVRASLDDASPVLSLTSGNGGALTGYSPAKWAASTAYALGQQVVPTTLNGHVYTVSGAGTSGGSEPTWPTTPGGTVVNGGVTFKEAGTDSGVSNVLLYFAAATTSAVADWGQGFWDLEVVDASGNVQRVLQGTAVLDREATR